MSDNVIEVQNLTKRYGETTVVKGISLWVNPEKFWATWSERFWQNHHHLDAAWID